MAQGSYVNSQALQGNTTTQSAGNVPSNPNSAGMSQWTTYRDKDVADREVDVSKTFSANVDQQNISAKQQSERMKQTRHASGRTPASPRTPTGGIAAGPDTSTLIRRGTGQSNNSGDGRSSRNNSEVPRTGGEQPSPSSDLYHQSSRPPSRADTDILFPEARIQPTSRSASSASSEGGRRPAPRAADPSLLRRATDNLSEPGSRPPSRANTGLSMTGSAGLPPTQGIDRTGTSSSTELGGISRTSTGAEKRTRERRSPSDKPPSRPVTPSRSQPTKKQKQGLTQTLTPQQQAAHQQAMERAAAAALQQVADEGARLAAELARPTGGSGVNDSGQRGNRNTRGGGHGAQKHQKPHKKHKQREKTMRSSRL
ncbi:hypothetical protein PMZ80_008078 [Knufia obscura]|uniref:Uncharacterized protein n=1 Tax=Knufia obscura TaxID=1635080 RepID=A0ABR0RHN6_9EURO|nr:hypothetical protein PMZ80_008078 [Knufia obscura]